MRRILWLGAGLFLGSCACGTNPGTEDSGVVPAVSCENDFDCGLGQSCVNNECTAGITGDGGSLLCATTADCPAGLVCLPSTGECFEPIVPDAGEEPDSGIIPTCNEFDQRSCGQSKFGECRLGIQTCTGGVFGECIGFVGPQTEACNAKDDNCDGLTDEGFVGQMTSCGSGACRSTVAACVNGVVGTCTPLTPPTCADLGLNCGTVADTCGGALNCGGCTGPQTCGGGGTPNICGCTPLTCAGLGKNCGTLSDGCGGTLACGTCTPPQSCGGGGVANVCGCTPTTCAAQGKNCGSIPDGCGGTLSCGNCPPGPDGGVQTCGGGGAPNVCGSMPCIPTTCAAQGKNCGIISDGCGVNLNCGTCTTPQTCGGGGTANVCGCTPTTCAAQGKNCGTISDGCGTTLSCGACSGFQTCGGGGTANVCGCTPTTCTAQGKNCGFISDGCGGTLPNCGICVQPQTCGGGGTPNVCGCTGGGGTDADLDGYTVCAGDCNDSDATIRPGATEICDGRDNDCDGFTDEGFDTDNDCFTTCGTNPGCKNAACAAAWGACTTGLQSRDVDCNDANPVVFPRKTYDCGNCASQTCPYCSGTGACVAGSGNGVDDNCNGRTDETCNCSSADADGDGFSQCTGDCNDANNRVYPGAPELCDGLDNDCNSMTTQNCDVGQDCSWAANDVCKDRYLCAIDQSTNRRTCGSFCNFSLAGAGIGDGCAAGQSCSASLVIGYNDHLCTASGTTSTNAAGASCKNDSECKSGICAGVGNQKWCSDRCGNDKNYCSVNTTCQIRNLGVTTALYTGQCILTAGISGMGGTGANCSSSPSICRHGTLACFNGLCAEPCCRNSDCPSGNFCTLRGPAVQVGTLNGTGEPVDTGMPVCVPKTTSGTRVSGQACTANSQCVSDFCEAIMNVCVDKCCNDADCPGALRCEYILVEKQPGGHVEAMRVCISVPPPASGRLRMR